MSLILILWESEGASYWAFSTPTIRTFSERFRRIGMSDVLARIAKEQSREFAREVDFPLNIDPMIRRSSVVAEQVEFGIAWRLAKAHRDWISKRAKARRVGDDIPTIADLYTLPDAKRESITSITELVSATELDGRDYLSEHHGIEVETYWTLDPQSNWCPICLALADTPEREWSIEFPKGPPAHPNCRCFLTHSRIYSNEDDLIR